MTEQLSPGEALLAEAVVRHKQHILDYLDNPEVSRSQRWGYTLWFSVGYFLNGSGRGRWKEFLNDDQGHMLLLATDRREDARNFRSQTAQG